MPPTVSVIIPAYNQAQFIRQAIDSVLAQTFSDYEIIVVNDGSTDETPQILAGYGDSIHIVNQDNSGLPAARNAGLHAARGEFICLLDSDDMLYPPMLFTLVSHLRKHPGIDLVSGTWDIMDETGAISTSPTKSFRLQAAIRANFLRTIVLGNLFLVHTLLVRRKCFECCGEFDTTLKAVEDWDMWVRMAAHGHKADLIDVPVASYRRHSGGMTSDPHRMEQASNQLLTRLFTDTSLESRLKDLREHAFISMWLIIAGFYQEAGLEAERRQFVQKAEMLYQIAPQDKEAVILHLGKLLSLPDTESFVQKITSTMPETVLKHYWFRGQQLFQRKDYQLIRSRLRWRNIQAFIKGLKNGLFNG